MEKKTFFVDINFAIVFLILEDNFNSSIFSPLSRPKKKVKKFVARFTDIIKVYIYVYRSEVSDSGQGGCAV